MSDPAKDAEIGRALTEIFRNVMQQPDLELRRELQRADISGWDSMAHIQLVLAVEARFKVKFAASEITKFANVGQLWDLVAQKTSVAAPV